MARNDGVDRTFARNRDLRLDKKATPQSAYEHNERTKESYSNADIVPERTPLNVHFKTPVGTYEECFDALEREDVISTWGMKPNSTKMCELIFDVNSAYFYNHGGYDFAKQFYADAYQAAVKIVGGEQYILSAVMHADERNRGMSEALDEDVYHYHLHVVYVPVVQKEILWSKRCKDPSLVGTVKKVVPQVSRVKKWYSAQAVDENRKPMYDAKGKPVLHHSYSDLQDDFFQFIREAGYTDVERGERGSSEEHLTVTQFKVEKEKQRLSALVKENTECQMDIACLEEKKAQAEDELHDTEKEVSAAQERLNDLTPQIEDAEAFIEEHLGKPEALLPESGVIERGTRYREEKAMLILKKLWQAALSLYHKLQELRREYRALRSRYDTVCYDRDYYMQGWDAAREENNQLKTELQDFDRVKRELGPDQVQNVIALSKAKEAAERERKAAEQEAQRAAKRAAHARYEWDAR